MAEAKRDGNFVPTLLGVSSTDGITPVTIYADPTTHRLYVDSTDSAFIDLTDVPASYTGAGGKVLTVKVDESGLEFVTNMTTDEKVKYDAGDTTAGYLSAKVVAGTGITLSEGAGADENKLKITMTESDPKFYATVAISHHYTGFPDRTATSLSFDDGTYTLTLTSTADPIWIDGIEYPINTLTKQLSVAQEAVSGLYWFWLTQSGGTVSLNADTNAPGFDKCLVATVYWNTTTNKGIISDERHWMGRDKWWHEYTHETIGARYASGMAGAFTNTTFQIDDGEFYDEDIEHDLGGNITTAKVLYHNGDADWVWDTLTTPYKVVNPGVDNNLRYNNGNALATVDNNKYMNQWVFATGDVTNPIHIVIGTAQYATIALARAASVPSLGSLGTAENKLIYKVTYQNVGGTPTYVEATDYRSSTNLPNTNYVATDHGSLTGLADDDHPQYLKRSLNGALSADETYDGITITGTLGATIASGDLCYLNDDDGRWELADANLSDGFNKQLGICVSGGNDGDSTTMFIFGKIRSAAFPAFTVGAPLFMSETAGDITHTAPTTTDSATRVVGHALTAEDLMFNPSNDWIIHT